MKETDFGFRQGQKWAEETASKTEVDRLNDWWDAFRTESDRNRWLDADDAYSAAERLYFEMNPDDAGDREAAKGFWSLIVGDDESPDTGFVRGFAEGALEFEGVR